MNKVRYFLGAILVILALFGIAAVIQSARELVVDLQFLHLARLQQEQQIRQQQQQAAARTAAPQKDPANEPR